MKDRREPEARRLLRLIAGDFDPRVVDRLDAQLTAELARTDDTVPVTFVVPDTHGARLTVRGFPPTFRQRFLRVFRR